MADERTRDPERVSGWARTCVAFAACILFVVGVFQLIAGLAAMIDDQFYVVAQHYAFEIDTSAWCVIHLIIGIVLVLTPLIGLVFPMPRVSADDVEMIDVANEPEVALAITARSGPIIIELYNRLDPESARQFYDVMLKIQLARLRNGAFDWSLSRDIADPALLTDRYHCPTWGDYLRLRSRITHSDRELQALADRWAVVGLLQEGLPYREIQRRTGVSVTTVGRVARYLTQGNGGYALVVKRLEEPRHG